MDFWRCSLLKCYFDDKTSQNFMATTKKLLYAVKVLWQSIISQMFKFNDDSLTGKTNFQFLIWMWFVKAPHRTTTRDERNISAQLVQIWRSTSRDIACQEETATNFYLQSGIFAHNVNDILITISSYFRQWHLATWVFLIYFWTVRWNFSQRDEIVFICNHCNNKVKANKRNSVGMNTKWLEGADGNALDTKSIAEWPPVYANVWCDIMNCDRRNEIPLTHF